jgi:hypothetical protein
MEMVAPTRVGMSLDDFIEEFERQPFELFNGERLAKMPNVVEIVSPMDKYTDITRKVDRYLEDGVRLVWVIDPQRRKAAVYAPSQPPLLVNETDMLRGDDIIPGFEIQLAELFK